MFWCVFGRAFECSRTPRIEFLAQSPLRVEPFEPILFMVGKGFVIWLKLRANGCSLFAGVQLTVTGVAQVKVMTRSEELLQNALVQFLGRSVKEIEDVILQTLEGHLRAILGEYLGPPVSREVYHFKLSAVKEKYDQCYYSSVHKLRRH